ncbi:hypothetical protein AOG23_21640 [Rhizobium acidisoli]|nr:hypothetical protein AOG23_21640 [Rhizobium acidisoli]
MPQTALPFVFGEHRPRTAIKLLARIVTNASLDRLRHLKARRETYIGLGYPSRSSRSKKAPSEAADIGIAGNL